MDLKPVQFISESVAVAFDHPPGLRKKPSCPDAFTWRGETHHIAEMLSEWQDFARRGRMSRNMTADHAAAARVRGSWGVGRFYFRVRTRNGRVFELYYDRAPKDAGDRQGNWYLYRELTPEEGPE
jgi:hypothetical protein